MHMYLGTELQYAKTGRNYRRIKTFTIIFREFNIYHSVIDRTSRQTISKDTEEMNNAINQLI